MSKRSKVQMGVDKKKRQKERREGIERNLRDNYLSETAVILSALGVK